MFQCEKYYETAGFGNYKSSKMACTNYKVMVVSCTCFSMHYVTTISIGNVVRFPSRYNNNIAQMDIMYDKYKFLIEREGDREREREGGCIGRYICSCVCVYLCSAKREDVIKETCHQDRAWNRHIR